MNRVSFRACRPSLIFLLLCKISDFRFQSTKRDFVDVQEGASNQFPLTKVVLAQKDPSNNAAFAFTTMLTHSPPPVPSDANATRAARDRVSSWSHPESSALKKNKGMKDSSPSDGHDVVGVAPTDTKRNPFNRRRDVIKTSSPVTSLHQLTLIPTRLLNLDDSPREDSNRRLIVVDSASNDHINNPPIMFQGSSPHRVLPTDFVPGDKDVVIDLQNKGVSSDSITSLSFEVMIHSCLLNYIRSTRQERTIIIDRIVTAISNEKARFVRYYSGRWIEVDEDTARDFTIRAMKSGARDVLNRIRERRQAQSSLQLSSRKTRAFANKQKLRVKFKLPKNRLMKIPSTTTAAGHLHDNNPQEILSRVACMQH